MAMLCSCDDVPTPSNFAEPVLFRIHRHAIRFSAAIRRDHFMAIWSAAYGPILQIMQLQACINEDQFHFGTLYKKKKKNA